MSTKGKKAANAAVTAVVNVGRLDAPTTLRICGPVGKVFISNGYSKVDIVKVTFENLILFTNQFFNPTTLSLQITSCY